MKHRSGDSSRGRTWGVDGLKVKKGNPIPLYYQLAEEIRDQIRLGKLNDGDKLPSEVALSGQAGVSRMTARQAISVLVRERLIVVKPGVGTFVAGAKLTYDALHLLGFTETVLQQGGTVTSDVFDQSVIPAPEQAARELGIPLEEPVVRVGRLRRVDGVPLLLESSFVPRTLCEGLEHEDLSSQSLYALLERKYGLRLKGARQTVEARSANDYEQQLFDVGTAMTMICLEGATYNDQDRAVEYFRAMYRGDRFKLAVESCRNDHGGQASGAPRVSVLMLEESATPSSGHRDG
jgi:GntR family transcriptional regulator